MIVFYCEKSLVLSKEKIDMAVMRHKIKESNIVVMFLKRLC